MKLHHVTSASIIQNYFKTILPTSIDHIFSYWFHIHADGKSVIYKSCIALTPTERQALK